MKLKMSSSYLKSTIELKHFHLHNFKNTTIEILNIKKKSKGTTFSKIIVYEIF